MRTKNIIHPGVILKNRFMVPLGITQHKLAADINVPTQRINEIVNGKRSITADTAIRLSKYFKNSPEFWMNLQSNYELCLAKRNQERVLALQ